MKQIFPAEFDRKATKTDAAAALTSLICNVPRQSPNTCGRKGSAQGSGRIQARGGRKIRTTVLHNQSRREECPGLSLRRMGEDRGEVVAAFHLQSHQEEVPGPYQLLRSAGGDGWTGSIADSAVAA